MVQPHEEGFDIQCFMPKWIIAQIAIKVCVDKHPIKGGVESSEDRYLSCRVTCHGPSGRIHSSLSAVGCHFICQILHRRGR